MRDIAFCMLVSYQEPLPIVQQEIWRTGELHVQWQDVGSVERMLKPRGPAA